jgi:hypothetical protein
MEQELPYHVWKGSAARLVQAVHDGAEDLAASTRLDGA